MNYNILSIVHILALLWAQAVLSTRDLPSIALPILATTENVESDKVAFYYAQKPLLIGNDGSADKGGIHVYNIDGRSGDAALTEVFAKSTGRTKVVSAVYSVAEDDYIVTFSTPEHTLRFYELPSGKEVKSASKFILAEFSALCPWRSPVTNEQYIYLFGKKEVRMYILQERNGGFQAVEVLSTPEMSRLMLTDAGHVIRPAH
jgi:3-phytase